MFDSPTRFTPLRPRKEARKEGRKEASNWGEWGQGCPGGVQAGVCLPSGMGSGGRRWGRWRWIEVGGESCANGVWAGRQSVGI